MTPEELEIILREESDRVEWKSSVRTTEELLEPVCALANDLGETGRPGYLLVGLDKKGAVVGIPAAGPARDEESQRIVNRVSSTLLMPTPSFSLEVVEHPAGGEIFLLRVEPYPVPPAVRFKQVVWVRKGTVTDRAREADLTRLSERRPLARQPFDGRPLEGAGIDDLVLDGLRARHAAEREGDAEAETFPDLDRWLVQKGLGSLQEGAFLPNAAAVLLFGKSPVEAIPSARVELVRYGGVDVDAPVVLRKPIAGALPDQLDAVWSQLRAFNAAVPAGGEGIREPYVELYPLKALEELARNLVQHRLYQDTRAPGRIEWYEDRVVFSNPGGPFGQASEGAFGEHSDYRNPTLTSWLAELGYVEQLGRGIRRVRLLLERNGNPPLEVETDGYTRVTVRRVP